MMRPADSKMARWTLGGQQQIIGARAPTLFMLIVTSAIGSAIGAFYAAPDPLGARGRVLRQAVPASPGSNAWLRADNLVVSGDCDAFGQGVGMVDGMAISHGCLVGYTPVGNPLRTCRRTSTASGPSYDGTGALTTVANFASYDGPGILCLSQPPTFDNSTNGFVFGVKDRSEQRAPLPPSPHSHKKRFS